MTHTDTIHAHALGVAYESDPAPVARLPTPTRDRRSDALLGVLLGAAMMLIGIAGASR